MMAAAGYVVLAPDSFAGRELGLRYRVPTPNLAAETRRAGAAGSERFWCANNVYRGDCPPFNTDVERPPQMGCYSSSASDILSDPKGWRSYYERIYELRRRELEQTLRLLPRSLAHAPKMFLAGASEGAMVVARFSNPEFEARLSGRIVLQWSCERNYYMSCNALPSLCEGRCASSSPVLALIGQLDPYFSAGGTNASSIADKVARESGGAPLTGSCYAQMRTQRLSRAISVVLPQHLLPLHGLGTASPNIVHALLSAFLRDPAEMVTSPPLAPEAGLCVLRAQDAAGPAEFVCSELGAESLRLPPGNCSWAGEFAHSVNYELGSLGVCATSARASVALTPALAAGISLGAAAVGAALALLCLRVVSLIRGRFRARSRHTELLDARSSRSAGTARSRRDGETEPGASGAV
mmetsp:Transcript_20632/g.52372  ORF Transcript_20632/g.52372 Transcript_20632/m.52372 type:complete len:410 (+) Transcript_20632:117-1346(+)